MTGRLACNTGAQERGRPSRRAVRASQVRDGIAVRRRHGRGVTCGFPDLSAGGTRSPHRSGRAGCGRRSPNAGQASSRRAVAHRLDTGRQRARRGRARDADTIAARSAGPARAAGGSKGRAPIAIARMRGLLGRRLQCDERAPVRTVAGPVPVPLIEPQMDWVPATGREWMGRCDSTRAWPPVPPGPRRTHRVGAMCASHMAADRPRRRGCAPP